MAENNLIKKADLARAREIDFTLQFGNSIASLVDMLGITRKIAKQAGTALKTYRAVGTLEDGNVAEGDTIPLSKYTTEPVTFGELKLKKWRKATSAEAIIERGFDQAVSMTTEKMLRDAQSVIRTDFITFLGTGTGVASGDSLQEALANAWGQLQIKYEDNAVEAVYVLNPLDMAEYLGKAQITTQTAFGMTYIADFLGLGTVIMSGSVPRGTFYATAKENIVLYFVPVNGADLGEAFAFTSDELGLIGIHEEADYSNMTAADTVINGMALFAERQDGIVVGTIAGE